MTHSKKNSTNGSDTTAQAEALDAMAEKIGNGIKRLTPKARQRLVKLRVGGVDTARTLATLVTRYKLGAMVDVDEMLKSAATLEELQPLFDSATNLQEIVHDQVLVAAAGTWKPATAAYTILQRMAVDDPRIADEIAPVAAKFALGKRKAATPADETTTASSTPVAVATPKA